ncbi:MAG: response regulator [Lachnospiraceae bacterium]|nr:response regulator [Lachnospiraceae bacterium]
MREMRKDYFNGKMINLLGYFFSAGITIVTELIFTSPISEYRIWVIGYLILSSTVLVYVASKGGWEREIKWFERLNRWFFPIQAILLSYILDNLHIYFVAVLFKMFITMLYLDIKLVRRAVQTFACVFLVMAFGGFPQLTVVAEVEDFIIYVACSLGLEWVVINIIRTFEYMMRQNYESEQSMDDLLMLVREKRDEAKQATKSKSLFLSNMSHDMRTPMNAIMGFCRLALKHTDDAAVVKDYLEKIMSSGNHLLSLINDVLDMSKIEAGRMLLHEKEENIVDIIEEIRNLTAEEASGREIDMEVKKINIMHADVYCDKLRLKQVLINLVSNALKFTPRGGQVKIILQQLPDAPDGYAKYMITVRDTGIGMSADFLKQLFEPFTRENTNTVNGTQGTGLGMAIAKNIIDLMNGNIAVKSRQGEGTEFSITVDFQVVHNKEVLVDEAESIDFNVFKGKHILLAEDNALNQEIAMEILKEVGFEVDAADNGKEAVEKYSSAQAGFYDVILMDIMMPEMNGYEAARAIRDTEAATGVKVPIYALTANAFDEDVQYALDAGMNGHLAKPIDVEQLFKVLYRCFR